jgi:hypothetical protein
MGDYTTASAVADFLNLPRFSTSTTPTSTTIEERIDEAEAYIDQITGHAWRNKTISNEYHELNLGYEALTGIPVYLNHRGIKNLATASGDKLEIWDGGTWSDWLVGTSRTEGRDKDYWLRYEDGVLYIRNWTRYPKGVRVTYRYGETIVPYDIKKAALLLTCIDLIATDDKSVQLPEGTSQLTYRDKIDKWERDIKEILSHHFEFRLPTR